ncbi:sugar ABC transporter permease [Actinoplanes ianthinogenes]|uniref:Sugar ABC transporter permease n=1 Tax=Actinoplanes ianthinogenes TaxID=122358 RepID=A0ABM7M1W0_9ACTN|nr:carbohydrate ABC transporter permease [Actinoplanes ianthinogenes]BCJ45629.1 sugar ABC transporter permease [Actinoplanes ianthinogenes]GGR57393.1 sugar ABC transporter permease [Actinoplanes ianthinogenes]
MAVLTSTPPRRKTRRADDGVMTVGRSPAGNLIANISGVIFAIVMFFPVYWVLITSFKPQTEWSSFTPTFFPDSPTLDNFKSAFNAPLFKQSLVNGVLVTAMAVVAALIIGFLGALAVARFRFYGRRAIIMVVLAVQLIPFISLLIPIFLMLQNWHAVGNTLVGVTLVYTVLILPYTVWMLRGFIAGIPRELDEAAMIDGCTRGQVFWRIVLPLTGPGLVATSVYGFIQAWNEFMIINTLNDPEHQNLMAWLMQNQTSRGTYWGPLMAGAIITSIPVVIFFLAVQRNIASGLTAGAVKG